MNNLLNQLNERVAVLKRALKNAEHHCSNYPEGRLRISSGKRQIRFYHVTQETDITGEYIPKDRSDLAKALAQKDYNEQFLKEAQKELAILQKTLSKLAKSNADLVYQKLSPGRKKLVDPYILPDEIYIEEWLSEPFKPNPYMPENKIYDTKRGDMVRSKSEAIIADMLLDLGIPYHYEKPIRLKGGAKRYPDFTLLKVAAREEVYLEHFGLLDDEDYRNACLIKMSEYRRNGIYPGKNLLFTYETADFPLDIKGFRKMLSYLLI